MTLKYSYQSWTFIRKTETQLCSVWNPWLDAEQVKLGGIMDNTAKKCFEKNLLSTDGVWKPRAPALRLSNQHRWLARSGDWHGLLTADFNKNTFDYALKNCFWKELKKLKNENGFVLCLVAVRGRYTRTGIYLRYNMSSYCTFYCMEQNFSPGSLQQWQGRKSTVKMKVSFHT